MILSLCFERESFVMYRDQYVWNIKPGKLSLGYINLQLWTQLHIGEVKIAY